MTQVHSNPAFISGASAAPISVPSSGEIFSSMDSLQNSIAKCEFAVSELVSRLGPVLASPQGTDAASRLTQPSPAETIVAQAIQAAEERVQSMIHAVRAATERLALP